jgi:pyrroline-5-carboxylate reductase
MKKIAIIGTGNLGTAITEGLLESGFVSPSFLTITKRNPQNLERFQKQGVQVFTDNKETIKQSEVIIICLKPYQVKEFLKEHDYLFRHDQLIISAVTGISLRDIRDLLGDKAILCRAMPNTAIAIRQSITCLAFENAGEEHVSYVKQLFDQLGKVVVIEEKLMDAATVLGACGTAFAMRYIRANIQGGIEIGFDAATASFIAAQTIKGAAQMLLEKNTHPEQEIDKVTTPRGCTIAGLNEMEHQGFSSSLIKGLMTSYERIQEF